MTKSSLNPQKPRRKGRFILFLIILVELVILANFLYPLLRRVAQGYIDQKAVRQTEWVTYNPNDTSPKFALLKVNKALMDGNTLTDEDFFFKNRLSVFGWDSTYEECKQTQYKCGDGDWQDFDTRFQVLSNRCMVKIGPKSFCNVLLPGGTLINATNYAASYNVFDEDSLVFQVIITDEQITIKQKVTREESSLWHMVSVPKGQRYVVEIGDQTVLATGTTFGTLSSLSTQVAAAVTQGKVQVATSTQPTTQALTLNSGAYSLLSAYDTTQCPSMLKACGENCIPGNAVCCEGDIGGSYCLSPLSCAYNSNTSSPCTTGLFFGSKSAFCCASSSDLADSISLINRGSYDCPVGKKFCGMSCIPADQQCCYPTSENCGGAETVPLASKDIPSTINIPRLYLNEFYQTLLKDPAYQKLISDAAFPGDSQALTAAANYFFDHLRAKLVKEDKAANQSKEASIYCSDYPNNCSTTKSSGSSSSSSGCSSSDGAVNFAAPGTMHTEFGCDQ